MVLDILPVFLRLEAEQLDGSGILFQQSRKDVDGGALAGPVRPQQAENLPFFRAEGDAIYRSEGLSPLFECLYEVADFNVVHTAGKRMQEFKDLPHAAFLICRKAIQEFNRNVFIITFYSPAYDTRIEPEKDGSGHEADGHPAD